jgi:hypothetical protein
MTIGKRMKASDVFVSSNVFLAGKETFKEAFPQIERLKVEVEESDFGNSPRLSIYSEANCGEYIDCSIPLCYNGGFRVGQIVRNMVTCGETEYEDDYISCQGYEGSPKGRRKNRNCLHCFKVKISSKYRPNQGKP